MPTKKSVNSDNIVEETFEENSNKMKLRKILDKQEVQHDDYFSYHQFKKRQNIAILTVGLVTSIVLVLGAVQISSMFRVPFPDEYKYTGDTSAYDDVLARQQELLEQDPEILKTKDTDEDGINDFDELYVYETSVYLADSDSDGIDDGEEIKNFQDPLCPEGYDCYTTYDDSADEGVVVNSETGEPEVTPEDLRIMIIASGQATAAQVNEINDASLMQMYEQMVKDNPEIKEQLLNYVSTKSSDPTAPVTSVDLESSDVGQTMNNLTSLTPTQVRALMLEQGFSATDLNAIDDETLMQLYYDAVEQASSNTFNN